MLQHSLIIQTSTRKCPDKPWEEAGQQTDLGLNSLQKSRFAVPEHQQQFHPEEESSLSISSTFQTDIQFTNLVSACGKILEQMQCRMTKFIHSDYISSYKSQLRLKLLNMLPLMVVFKLQGITFLYQD